MLSGIPWESLLGGMLLGVSASLLLMMNGRIAGISGIVSGLFKWANDDVAWRVFFILGMVSAGVLAFWAGYAYPSLDVATEGALGHIVIAGLLVGAGTTLGNGCTSGHGICGIGRLSKRSIVATAVFMGVAMITVFVRLHVL
ncbi:YeeE/YedE family protein [Thaumasiovibrio subtropicus]|uniref:YeeE/YedE family protein n=1 Tax=Thaumasiovibrio subtropicus TaxID=1891207 RepID=UPI000B356302|nr:YeeE/YedE family protein [Thaumasiovibrio subtropicus]